MFHIPERSGYPLGRTTRWLLGLWGLLLLCGFVVAFELDPDPRGFGTHEKLGLPPCTFRQLFGIPCPSCGMTTSISNFVRGRFIESARDNLGGFVLATICFVQIPWSMTSAVRKRLIGIEQPELLLVWILGLVCGTTLLQWVARLF